MDIAWHLVESIGVRNACSCMYADLMGSSNPRGFSRASKSGRFKYNDTVLGVVRSLNTVDDPSFPDEVVGLMTNGS